MDTAIVWYRSRALWAMVATVLLSAASHFGIGLPPGVDKDSVTAFLLGIWPVAFAIYERITATKIIVGTPQKAADINATTVKVSAADAPSLPSVPPSVLSLMIAVPVLGVMITIGACSGVPKPQSVGQGLFIVYGVYDAAVTGANSYAQSPDADRAVVHVLAEAYRTSKPAADLVVAYKQCVVSHLPSAVIDGVSFPCGSYNFSTGNLLQVETALRNAALTLQQAVPKK